MSEERHLSLSDISDEVLASPQELEKLLGKRFLRFVWLHRQQLALRLRGDVYSLVDFYQQRVNADRRNWEFRLKQFDVSAYTRPEALKRLKILEAELLLLQQHLSAEQACALWIEIATVQGRINPPSIQEKGLSRAPAQP